MSSVERIVVFTGRRSAVSQLGFYARTRPLNIADCYFIPLFLFFILAHPTSLSLSLQVLLILFCATITPGAGRLTTLTQ
jgi:hypothetical protein